MHLRNGGRPPPTEARRGRSSFQCHLDRRNQLTHVRVQHDFPERRQVQPPGDTRVRPLPPPVHPRRLGAGRTGPLGRAARSPRTPFRVLSLPSRGRQGAVPVSQPGRRGRRRRGRRWRRSASGGSVRRPSGRALEIQGLEQDACGRAQDQAGLSAKRRCRSEQQAWRDVRAGARPCATTSPAAQQTLAPKLNPKPSSTGACRPTPCLTIVLLVSPHFWGDQQALRVGEALWILVGEPAQGLAPAVGARIRARQATEQGEEVAGVGRVRKGARRGHIACAR